MRTTTTTAAPLRHLLTVRQFADAHPAISEGSLRWQIFRRRDNGLDDAGALVRIGSRIMIDVDRYYAWLDAQQTMGVRA